MIEPQRKCRFHRGVRGPASLLGIEDRCNHFHLEGRAGSGRQTGRRAGQAGAGQALVKLLETKPKTATLTITC